MKRALLIAVLILITAQLGLTQKFPIEDKETIRRSLQFAGSGGHTIQLDNVMGSIHVTGTDGAGVEMVANKSIRAASQGDLEQARQEVKIDVRDQANTVSIYVDGPFRNHDQRGSRNRWRDPGYVVNIDFDVRVPRGTKLWLRTVNAGNIHVEGVSASFDVENVNGDILMERINGSGRAITVNGPIKVDFTGNPTIDSVFQTVNGDITATFLRGFSADLRFKTFNGDVYTDFDVTHLPVVSPTAERRRGGVVYKSNQFSGYRVGKGGPEIKFDTLNGNIRVIRQTN